MILENIEFLKGCLTNAGLFTYYLGLMAVIAFQVNTQILLEGYLNMPKYHQDNFACGRNCIFQTVKKKQKFREDIW
jgi:hypothetical protein